MYPFRIFLTEFRLLHSRGLLQRVVADVGHHLRRGSGSRGNRRGLPSRLPVLPLGQWARRGDAVQGQLEHELLGPRVHRLRDGLRGGPARLRGSGGRRGRA